MPDPLVYNEQPRPRVLLYNVSYESVVEGLIPTARPTMGLSSVRTEDWDAIIAEPQAGEELEWAPHQCILQIGGKPAWSYKNFLYAPEMTRTHGEGVVLTGEGPSEFRRELKEVVKYVRDQPLPRWVFRRAMNEQVNHFTPLITDEDGNVYAALYDVQNGPREVLYLPQGLELSRAWVRLALEHWSTINPEAFPPGPEWTQRDEWMTASEREAQDEVQRLEQELEDETTRLTRLVDAAREGLQDMRTTVDANERLILTATGSELVAAIASTLQQFGFDVEDRDALGARQKFEDLRVSDGEWTAIAEVKGYTGGGSTHDLLSFTRFTREYQKETGQFPDALWYIVNQFLDRDPSSRMPLLRGQDSDVEAFGKSDGLVLDTRDLFRLARDHAEGKIDASAARALLIEARGRFQYLPSGE